MSTKTMKSNDAEITLESSTTISQDSSLQLLRVKAMFHQEKYAIQR